MALSEDTVHTVAEDECLSSIAEAYGHYWKTIWFHARNARLRKLREDPNVLQAGDELFIPATQRRLEPRATDQKHAFQRLGVPAMLRLRFLDGTAPRANQPYTLNIDGKLHDGTLDADGKLEVSIPPGAREGEITIRSDNSSVRYTLDLGRMDPVSEPNGAIKRLASLGYDCGLHPESGLAQALKTFQVDHDLPASGELDAATQRKLKEAFGC